MQENHTCRANRSKKTVILIASLILFLVAAVGGTAAYLRASSDEVTNTFIPAEVIIDINETKATNTKSDISFTNRDTENAVPVYIRATLVIYWTDTFDMTNDDTDNPTEQVIAKPADADVVLTENLGEDWFRVGEIYYYALPVEPGNTTATMLKDAITVTVPANSNVQCYIDVHAEAIQAEPVSVVTSVWKDVKVDGNGSLTVNGGA